MHRRRPYVLPIARFVHGRPRRLLGLALGLCGEILRPQALRPATRMLIGWNIAVWSYLLMVGWLMFRANSARVRATTEKEDPSATVVLALMSITAMASLAAIVLELAATRELGAGRRLIPYALTASTRLRSWLFVNTMFTLPYARMFYRSAEDRRPLRFPDVSAAPDYWDFLYFSFAIAAAAQTSDVSVMTRSMRKAVLGPSVPDFLFNVAIIGLSINVAAGLIES